MNRLELGRRQCLHGRASMSCCMDGAALVVRVRKARIWEKWCWERENKVLAVTNSGSWIRGGMMINSSRR